MEDLRTIIKLKNEMIERLKEAGLSASDVPAHIYTGQSDMVVVVDTVMEREHYEYNPRTYDCRESSRTKTVTDVCITVYVVGESLSDVNDVRSALSSIGDLKLSAISHVTLSSDQNVPLGGYRMGFKVTY